MLQALLVYDVLYKSFHVMAFLYMSIDFDIYTFLLRYCMLGVYAYILTYLPVLARYWQALHVHLNSVILCVCVCVCTRMSVWLEVMKMCPQ